jgi:paraquat-inducible protein B
MSETLPEARVRRRGRFSLVWLIPIVAALAAAYVAIATLSRRGPMITISFRSADGLTAGQTQVKHKAVALGTVESIELASDMSHVIVRVRMTAAASKHLTDHARFWVVRPRLSAGNISGLETLVSGSYIEMDPGGSEGKPQYAFTGLEEPPGIRSDEPGRTFVLRASRVGSIGSGAPVFYRDVVVGEVLGYDMRGGAGPVTINIFVHKPYDDSVHDGSRFWNASGLSVEFGSNGIHVEVESLQALLSGGVAFDTPREAREKTPVSKDNATFVLYRSQADADAAGYQERVPFVTYFDSSVSGLGPGSPVQVYGMQIGTVSDVRLELAANGRLRVRVRMEVQPQRVFGPDNPGPSGDSLAITQALVDRGMRTVVQGSNLLTGQMVLALDFVPNAPRVQVRKEGDLIVLPSKPGGIDSITTALSDFTQKLNSIPLDKIGANLDELLATMNTTLNGPEMKEALRSLTETMKDAQEFVRRADAGFGPVLKRLPDIANGLQEAATRANRLLGSMNNGYGQDSGFQRNLQRTLDQVNEAARSIRLLADYLDRHPEALIRGRASQATEP